MKYKIGVAVLSAALLAFIGLWAMNSVVSANTLQDKESEAGAYLGVYVRNDTDAMAEKSDLPDKEGALISGVMLGSPAYDAGLRRNDLVISVDGTKISSSDDLISAVKSHKPGDSIEITFIRNNIQQTLTVVLEKKKAFSIKAPYFVRGKAPFNGLIKGTFKNGNFNLLIGGAHLGIEFRELNPDLGTYFGLQNGKGILVTEVNEDSAAEKAGMKAGDVILSIDGKEISDTEDLQKALRWKRDEDKESLEVVVMRHNKRITLNVEVEESSLQNLFIAPHTFEGNLESLKENLKDLDLDINCDVNVPEIHVKPFEMLSLDKFMTGFQNGTGNICLVFPDGLNFRLEVRDNGTVTFNDKEFGSVKEFKDYMNSKEFIDLKREIDEKTKKDIDDKLSKVRIKMKTGVVI